MSEVLFSDDNILQKLKTYRDDLEWFQHNYHELKKQYKGEYVAIEDEKVIAHDEDLEKVLMDLKGKDMSKILIEHINESNPLYVL